MGTLVRAAVLLSPLLFCNAFLDLTGPSEIEGVWKGNTILPCAYVPEEDFVQHSLVWTVVHDQSSGTIFRRDSSGDHVLLSEYRDRVSVPKDAPGNVSLHILGLEFSDRGTYVCQVTWKASNNSLIVKDIATKVEVVKVPVTKPIIRVGELGLTVPAGARTSLTCVASGSPPISYLWFRSTPGRRAQLLSNQAELVWDSLQPSDAGTYYCEAKNRVGAGAAQQSDTVELRVTDLSATTVASQGDGGTSGRYHPTAVTQEVVGINISDQKLREGVDGFVFCKTVNNQTELLFEGTSETSWAPWDFTTITDLSVAVTPESGVGYPEKNYTTQDFQGTRLSLHLVILIAVVCGAVVFIVIFLIICIRKPKEAQVYEVKLHNSRAAASRSESMGHYEEPISSTENNYVMELTKTKESEEINTKKNEYDSVGHTQESEYEVGDTV